MVLQWLLYSRCLKKRMRLRARRFPLIRFISLRVAFIAERLQAWGKCFELPLVSALELQKLEGCASFLIGELKLAIVVKCVDIQVGTTDLVT